MKTIIPVASGKGGVGKTSLVSNLGIALAQAGKTVVVVDLDLGGSNLHTMLGVKNRHPGLGSYIYKKIDEVEKLLVPTDTDQLYLIPGDSLLPGTANLPYFIKKKMLKSLHSLVADYILIDLGSGSAYNTVDFFLTSPSGCLVTIPENTAILNAYAFLKTVMYRMIYLSQPTNSDERNLVKEFASQKIEGTDEGLGALVNQLEKLNPRAGEKTRQLINTFHPLCILNMVHRPMELFMAKRLAQIAEKNLGLTLDFLGSTSWEPAMRKSIQERTPLMTLSSGSDYENDVRAIAEALIEQPHLVKRTPFTADDLIDRG